MRTVTLILEPNADGTLHLPLPMELRAGMVKVNATLEAAKPVDNAREDGSPLGVFLEMRKRGGLRRTIPDPVSWQREQRKERMAPDRE